MDNKLRVSLAILLSLVLVSLLGLLLQVSYGQLIFLLSVVAFAELIVHWLCYYRGDGAIDSRQTWKLFGQHLKQIRIGLVIISLSILVANFLSSARFNIFFYTSLLILILTAAYIASSNNIAPGEKP